MNKYKINSRLINLSIVFLILSLASISAQNLPPAEQLRVKEITALTEDFNLDVGLRLRTQLQTDGATVVMTRTADVDRNLDARANFINNENPHAFISIHCNSFDDPSVDGTETYWYTEGDADDERLAGDVQTRLVEELGRRKT